MKFLKMAVVAAFACTLCFGFSAKVPVFEQNIVIEDICCLKHTPNGPEARRFEFERNKSVDVFIDNKRSSQMTLTIKDSLNVIKVSQTVRLTPKWDAKGTINVSSLKKGVKYKMEAAFIYESGTFTTPAADVFVN
jgi:hypothetical protein